VNLTILRAMFEDARQQVLDNKVFRLLVILCGIPILFTFLIGFHEEHISLLWGFKEVSYADLAQNFGGGSFGTEELDSLFIQGAQEIFIAVFAGMFGMMLCIAATAFFVPRILEKGAADTLFSKPVGRMTILMSRYLAGILFVAFISVVLVVGMYLGFLVVSGYNDPGFLWGALTLVYLYAMMHSFSTAVAVWTRSSTAAILLTIFLFMICGAVHGGWIGYSYHLEQQEVAELRSEAVSDEEESDEESAEDEEEEDGSFVDVLLDTLSVLHYVLPKTSDADMITAKVKRAITEKDPQIETEDGDLLVKLPPTGFALVEESRGKLETTGVTWISESEGGEADGRVSIRRYERPEVEREIAGRTRVRPLYSREAAEELHEELEEQGEDPDTDDTNVSNVRVLDVKWEPEDGGTRNNRLFFHFGEYMYEVDIVLAKDFVPQVSSDEEESGGGNEAQDFWEESRWRRRFFQNGNVVLGQLAGMNPDEWYRKTFDWDAELKYNIFFSIGTTLAFILAMLALAWFRLRQIDF